MAADSTTASTIRSYAASSSRVNNPAHWRIWHDGLHAEIVPGPPLPTEWYCTPCQVTWDDDRRSGWPSCWSCQQPATGARVVGAYDQITDQDGQ